MFGRVRAGPPDEPARFATSLIDLRRF